MTSTSGKDASFGKDRRIRKRKEFRLVYDTGRKQTRRCFAVFCLNRGDHEPTRVGFTTPRALGKANQRNRIRRRVREAVRVSFDRLPIGWSVVFNPRRVAAEASFADLIAEVVEVLDRCAASSS